MIGKLLAAALILVAASAHQAQACGGCGCQMKLKEAAAPAQEEMAQHAHHHPSPLALFAVSMYGQLGDQMGELRSKAEGGCQDSKSTLRADAMHSVQSMLKALKDPEMRKMIEMGMMPGVPATTDTPKSDDGGLCSVAARPRPGAPWIAFVGLLAWVLRVRRRH